jgi:hypothetical protein
MAYTGPERRNNEEILKVLGDIREEMAERFTRIETNQENQVPRCNSHAADIRAIDDRTSSLESTRDYAKGIVKTVGVGGAATGSILWFVDKCLDAFKGIK